MVARLSGELGVEVAVSQIDRGGAAGPSEVVVGVLQVAGVRWVTGDRGRPGGGSCGWHSWIYKKLLTACPQGCLVDLGAVGSVCGSAYVGVGWGRAELGVGIFQ